MQKFLKKFAAIFAAVLMIACMAAFAVACEDKTPDDDKNNNNQTNDDTNNTDGTQYATDEFVVIVKDENGNPIDGTKDGGGWESDALEGWPADASVQFCSVISDEHNVLGTCNNPVAIGADGKATISLESLRTTAETLSAQYNTEITLFELHICNVESKGYTKGETDGTAPGVYGRFDINEMPLEITVTLILAEAE